MKNKSYALIRKYIKINFDKFSLIFKTAKP